MYFIVKEIMTVTRLHLVSGSKKQAIKDVKDCNRNVEYLQSCDELDWEGTINYEIVELDDDLNDDFRLKQEARHIEERLYQEIPETDLTKRKNKRIMKAAKTPTELDCNNLLEQIDEQPN